MLIEKKKMHEENTQFDEEPKRKIKQIFVPLKQNFDEKIENPKMMESSPQRKTTKLITITEEKENEDEEIPLKKFGRFKKMSNSIYSSVRNISKMIVSQNEVVAPSFGHRYENMDVYDTVDKNDGDLFSSKKKKKNRIFVN